MSDHFCQSLLQVFGLVWLCLSPGCDCSPARSKPWRHGDIELPGVAVPATAESAPGAAAIQPPDDQRDSVLRIHMDARPSHLNPLVAPSQWTHRITLDTVFETLIRYQPPPGGAGTGPGNYVAGLAQRWQQTADGREIRIDLQPDALFHDDRRVTSVDVQFTVDAARSARGGAEWIRDQLRDVAAVELISARALRIRLRRPNGYVLRALASLPILPEHVYQGRLRAGARGPVIGSGPYRFDGWHGDTVRLVRADSYWGAPPTIPRIEFVYEPDAAIAISRAKQGELDIIPALIPEHYPGQITAPGIASRFSPLRLHPAEMAIITMDARKAPFDDRRVRHAVALLVDRRKLVKDVYHGLAVAIPGPVWPGGPGDGPPPAPPSYDPGRAARLLDQSGWRDVDGDGKRERRGEPLRVSVLAIHRAEPRYGSVIESLRRSGFVVDVRVGSEAVLENRLEAGDFGLAFVDWRSAVDRDLSGLLESDGAENYGGVSSPRIDQILAAARLAWEPRSRAPILGTLAAAFAEEWPFVPLVARRPVGLIHQRIRGAVVWDGWIGLRDLSFDSALEE